MNDRCDLTDLLVDQCAHCRGHHAPSRSLADLQVARRVIAIHDSRCALDARHGIAPGDRIALAVDGDDTIGWICPACDAAVSA